MATIFSSGPGTVVRLRDNRAAISFRMSFNNDNFKGIVTQANITQQGNAQFLHTIDDFIYIYVFGDRISDMQISGMLFLSDCSGGNDGVGQALDYYAANRVAASGSAMNLLLGQRAFRGFLMQSNIGVSRPELNVGEFSLRYQVIPQN